MLLLVSTVFRGVADDPDCFARVSLPAGWSGSARVSPAVSSSSAAASQEASKSIALAPANTIANALVDMRFPQWSITTQPRLSLQSWQVYAAESRQSRHEDRRH